MKTVYFLGAGFSAPFGHPTMELFLGYADQCRRLAAEDRGLIGELVLGARRANSFLESSPANIEDILSFAVMGERLGFEKGKEQADKIKDILRRVFTDVPPGYSLATTYLRSFLGVEEGHRLEEVSFITTNYDMNLEASCWRLGLRVDPGFTISRQGDSGGVVLTGSLYESGAVPMFKLHGSVNWYKTEDASGTLVVEDGVITTREGQKLPYVCAQGYEPLGSPVIIPPSFLKPELHPALHVVWQRAAHALAEASVVAFVGYSFPPSDREMMYFLARALMENSALRRIYIIDKRADWIVDRLRSPEMRMGTHFRDLLTPIPGDWRGKRSPA